MPHNYTQNTAQTAITLMGMSYGMPKGVRRSGPCGTTLVTAFGSDLRSVDTLRSSRYALTQPDAFGAGASRDGHFDPILHSQTYPETLGGTMVSVTRVLHHALRIRRV